MIKLAIASALTLAAFSASAQMYGELGYTAVKFEANVDGDNLKSSPSAIRGVLGFEINPNLAIEGMVGLGLGDDKVTFNGRTVPGIKMDIDSMLGLYVKPKFILGPDLEGFVRLGFAQLKGSVSGYGQQVTDNESSFSYGLGFSYTLNPKTSLNVDYMSYLDKNDAKINGFTFGVGYKF
jgi:opacity protein-like surface antigen